MTQILAAPAAAPDAASPAIAVESEVIALDQVTDFGLSRIVHESAKKKYMTMCGSIQWLAPEVIRGDRCVLDDAVFKVAPIAFSILCAPSPHPNPRPISSPWVGLTRLRT